MLKLEQKINTTSCTRVTGKSQGFTVALLVVLSWLRGWVGRKLTRDGTPREEATKMQGPALRMAPRCALVTEMWMSLLFLLITAVTIPSLNCLAFPLVPRLGIDMSERCRQCDSEECALEHGMGCMLENALPYSSDDPGSQSPQHGSLLVFLTF